MKRPVTVDGLKAHAYDLIGALEQHQKHVADLRNEIAESNRRIAALLDKEAEEAAKRTATEKNKKKK